MFNNKSTSNPIPNPSIANPTNYNHLLNHKYRNSPSPNPKTPPNSTNLPTTCHPRHCRPLLPRNPLPLPTINTYSPCSPYSWAWSSRRVAAAPCSTASPSTRSRCGPAASRPAPTGTSTPSRCTAPTGSPSRRLPRTTWATMRSGSGCGSMVGSSARGPWRRISCWGTWMSSRLGLYLCLGPGGRGLWGRSGLR